MTNFTLRERTISQMRSYLRRLARNRKSGTVTADDAQRFLDRVGVSSNTNVRLSYINSVLASSAFVNRGTIQSSRPAARGRTITVWLVK